MTVDLVVRNGVVVDPRQQFAGGVAIDKGVIVAVGRDGVLPDGRTELDAGGQFIFPGLIDPHVHFRDPGLTYKEDFATGSLAAIYGGITSVLDMPNVVPPTADAAQILAREAQIQARAHCDFMLVGLVVQDNLDHIIPMAEAGAIGFKVFLGTTIGNIPAPDDGVLVDALGLVAETGLRIGFHAENDEILKHRTRQLIAAGRTDAQAFVDSRPAICEAESIQRVALFARYQGTGIHIYHLSSADGLAMIADHRAHGVDITTETGPHYLFLSREDMDEYGTTLRVNPPVREPAHGAALWAGVMDGSINFIADDHAPHTEEEKTQGIWEAMSGFVGVETLMQVMYSEGVVKRGMPLSHFVRVCSENGARAWNCYPQKGTLQVGADGDLTIFDPQRPWQIQRDSLHSKSRVTPWHLWEGTGQPTGTIVRGHVQMWDRTLRATQPIGRLIRPHPRA